MATKYCTDPAWADVVPVPQDDGPDPPVAIAYSPEYAEAMDYFRAILAKQERSQRVLDLITHIVSMNPSFYTVWQYRREVLAAVNADLHAELAYVGELILSTPKNYQLWYHRQVIVDRLRDPSAEKAMLREVFDSDAKNYHAWSFRQWLLQEFPDLWKGELEFVDELLTKDVCNNSAWTQRFYCLTHQPGRTVTRSSNDTVLAEEIKYVFDKIELMPNNESAWNYLRGLVDLRSFAGLPQVEQFCLTLRDRKIVSSYLYGMLVDIYEAKGDSAAATELTTILATTLDTVRRKYWQYRQSLLQASGP